MAKFIKNPFRKSSTSGQTSDKQETDPPVFHASRQPVDTQFDMETPVVESGGSLFEGMDFGPDDVMEAPPPQEISDLSSSALPFDLDIPSDTPPHPTYPVANPPPPPTYPPTPEPPSLLRDETEESQTALSSSQKKKTRKAKLPGGVSTGSVPRSASSTPTPRSVSPASAEMEPVNVPDREGEREKSQNEIRASVDQLLVVLSELETSRQSGEMDFESRVSQLTSRCELQRKRQELNQLVREAEEVEDFSTAERLSADLEGVERELRECDVRRDLLDVWAGFYSNLMSQYRRDVARVEEMSGVSQEAADRLEQEARREDQEFVRQTEEQRRALSLLVEKQDHAERQLGLDRDHVQRQKQILEDDVTIRTEQLVQERAQLETRVESLEEEIQELERKLSRLTSNREDSRADLGEVVERLGAVYDSVQGEKGRLDGEVQALELQGRELERHGREISERRGKFSDMEQLHLESSKSSRDKIDKLRHAPRLVACMQSMETGSQGYQEELEAVLFTQLEEAKTSQLNVNVSNLSSDIEQMSVSRQQCQEELGGLEWTLSKGEDKIRELDSVKKGLTQVKKYKEARETAEERKKISDKQEQLKLEIESKTTESSKLSREFEEKCSALEAARLELAKEEERSDANVMKCLQELTANLCKVVQLEEWDPRMELRHYKLKLFNMYIEELCIKHDWEYTPTVPIETSANSVGRTDEADSYRTESSVNSRAQASEARTVEKSQSDGVEEDVDRDYSK